jgi:uncharacterized protein
MTRADVTFTSQGVPCAGWLYRPDGLPAGRQAPAVVLAHGFSCVKEVGLAAYAERFAAAGIVALAFDYRYFGGSGGEPRGRVSPAEQIEDVRNALTWLEGQAGVDPERIGLWGSSLGGGIVTYTATFDRRVKAVVAQAASFLNPLARQAMNPASWASVGGLLLRDRRERYRTGAVTYLPVVAPDGTPCAVPGQENWDGYLALAADAPTWQNQITVESVGAFLEFDAASSLPVLAPTPLLIIAGERDALAPLDAVRAAYARAAEPKALQVLPVTHFEVYREPWRSQAVAAATDWFTRHLR